MGCGSSKTKANTERTIFLIGPVGAGKTSFLNKMALFQEGKLDVLPEVPRNEPVFRCSRVVMQYKKLLLNFWDFGGFSCGPSPAVSSSLPASSKQLLDPLANSTKWWKQHASAKEIKKASVFAIVLVLDATCDDAVLGHARACTAALAAALAKPPPPPAASEAKHQDEIEAATRKEEAKLLVVVNKMDERISSSSGTSSSTSAILEHICDALQLPAWRAEGSWDILPCSVKTSEGYMDVWKWLISKKSISDVPRRMHKKMRLLASSSSPKRGGGRGGRGRAGVGLGGAQGGEETKT